MSDLNCKSCLKNKNSNEFYKSCINKKGIGVCKTCKQKQHQNYYIKNKDKILIENSKYRKNHKEKMGEYRLKWIENHPNKVKESERKYKNKPETKLKEKKYRGRNKERIRSYHKKWERRKWETDPAFKIRKRISNSVNCALKNINLSKSGSILKHLPYKISDLKYHLESQFEPWMTWENWGNYDSIQWDDNDVNTWTWHIDHIIPQSKLPYNSMSHPNFKKCWSMDNLRPLSAKDNLIKSNKI